MLLNETIVAEYYNKNNLGSYSLYFRKMLVLVNLMDWGKLQYTYEVTEHEY